jgi:lantibiotic biosynthesis protein
MPNASSISCWPSIASESQHAVILRILDELVSTLDQSEEASLAGGAAGTALFIAYCSRLPGMEALQDQALELLGQAVRGVSRAPGATLYSGYVGIAWAVEHLQQMLGCGPEEEDINEGVDEVLLDLLAHDPWQGHYDLISGLTGLGVYALERRSKPGARQVLSRILDHLEALAVPRSIGCSWPTRPELLPPWQRQISPNGYFNLGVAHGIPGVLLLLAALEQTGRLYPGIDHRRAGKLLEGGMDWIFSQFQAPETGSCLASWCPLDQEIATRDGNRVAWCYGDLGASLAILDAARLVGRTDWETQALSMARLAAVKPLSASGVRDTCLCHGSGGNALIFQRLFQQTGEACFEQAARLYLEHVIHTRMPGAPLGGYTFYRPPMDSHGKILDSANVYHADPSLLDGSVGVGLALLAAIGVEPAWDRCLLLSLPE